MGIGLCDTSVDMPDDPIADGEREEVY